MKRLQQWLYIWIYYVEICHVRGHIEIKKKNWEGEPDQSQRRPKEKAACPKEPKDFDDDAIAIDENENAVPDLFLSGNWRRRRKYDPVRCHRRGASENNAKRVQSM